MVGSVHEALVGPMRARVGAQGTEDLEEVLSERLQQLPPPLSVHGGSASPIREEAGREGLGVQPSDELPAEPSKARARSRACARKRFWRQCRAAQDDGQRMMRFLLQRGVGVLRVCGWAGAPLPGRGSPTARRRPVSSGGGVAAV